jgi:sterol 3beta-glucosyltransferase
MKIGLQTWGSDGDIRPFLALAGGLRARGHEVSLVVTSVDNKDYSSYGRAMDFAISHVGARSYDDKTTRLFQDKIIGTENSLKQIEIILDHFFNPVISEMFDAAEWLCRENDVIIGHSIHHPVQTAAEKAGKPHATVMMNHAGVYSKHSPIYGVPNLGKWMNPYWWKLFHFTMDRTIGVDVNKLRKRVGLPPVTKIADTVWISKALNLIAETSAIGRKQPDWPDYHHVCGVFTIPSAAEQWTMPDDLKRFLEAGPPPVFITLGSMYSLDASPGIITETLVQGALLAGCRAIVQSRWDELREFHDHPGIYKIQKAPHRNIFPYCSMVVHHGGAGTTHSATLHGCPSVVIEHIADQSFFANELQRLGVAPRVLHRRNVTAGKLASAIRSVLDSPDMKKRAEELGAFMQKENGVKRAVELIEKRFSPGESSSRRGSHRKKLTDKSDEPSGVW